MSYGRRRGLRPVSPYVIVLALAVALTASFFLPTRAEAEFSDHTVTTISPSGTTINLFDYWVNPDNHLSVSGNGGINASHRFQFNDGQGDAPLNHWTGNTNPQPGIVSNTLSDGYPQLSGTYGGDSLRYLFDSSAQTGKTSHFGVTGLLKVQDGYYVYDSSENYAAYNADKNAFDVYDTWGIDKVGDSSHRGQFFPFDAADKVFMEESGRLVQNGITADNAGNHVNHHFGLSMSTRFVQPNGGLTNDKKDMTFEFAGDDDVWVFIDDVLVGDIGGIHSRASLSINFHTGDIKVNDKSDGTLLSKYQVAKKGTSGFDGNTFKDGTNHTLKFFYLERGATDSNMELKFNLVTVPESDIIKFDQDGGPVEGAQFALYKTDENFTDTTANQNNLLGSGTTNANGQLTLTNDVDNGVINFDDLYKEYHYQHYLLKETKAPNGYRSSLTATDGNMQLEYVPASDKKDAGGVIINRGGMDADSVVWKTGAFAAAKETITAPSTVYKANDNLTKSDKIDDLESGILFAVVLKRDKSANADIKDQNNWYAVSGDPSTGMGYTLAEKSSKAGAIEAAKKDPHAFTLNTSGQYQVEIQNLPGDISKYYYLLSGDARKDAEYTVAIYYTTASSIAEARMDNTVHVFSDDLPDGKENFRRQFATRLLVTNIQNRLFVQKTDSEGKPVDGAKFGLYKSTQVTEDANGKAVLNGEQTPYDTLTTRSVANPVKLEGAGIFPYTSDGKEPLVKDTYYLKEVSAPQGFLLNDTLTKVIVDDYGVHADAGTPDDGVSTFVGVGSLLKSLGQFGAEGDIDKTLTWIKGMRQTSDGVTDDHGNLSWSNVNPAGAGDTVHLKYGANGRIYQYGPTKAGEPYRLETETGWIRMGITQDKPGVANAKGARADLGDMNLNALFTGATCVRVANEREASLEVTKKVDVPAGLTGNKDAKFTFKFTVPEGKTYKAAVFKNAGAGKQAGDVFDLKNGDTHAIKADETIRVYGLAKGDNYTVQELTGKDEMPAGYKLTGCKQGDKNLKDAGDSVTGEIAEQNADGTVAKANKLVFTNTYTAEASDKLTPQVTKKVSGTESTDKEFLFTLAATSDMQAKIAAGDLTVSDDLAGDAHAESRATKGAITGKDGQTVDFSGMKFNKAGTYTFTLSEAHDADDDAVVDGVQNAGWTMDASAYTATVTVEDVDAKLTVTGVTVKKDGDAEAKPIKAEVKDGKVNLATFINSYAAKGSVTLAAKKHFTGGELAGGDFSFALYKGDKAEGTPIETVANDKDGNITFQAIGYDTPGDHDYTIKEVAGNDSTVVYDGKTVNVHVRVTDNKNGTLKAVATYGGDKAVPTFTNAKPTAGATVEATKTLTGKALTGGALAFGLYDQAGNEVAKGTNDRGGKVELAVENLNLGEYDYTLKEEKAGQTVDGVAYDAKEVKVHVKVEQNQGDNNKAKVTVTYDGAATAPTFNNTYDAKGSVILTATKTIKVADGFDHTTKPADGEFTFDLKDAAGNVLDTAKNDANGKVSFTREFQLSDLDGAASKDFTYTIVEQSGTEPSMVYDSHPLTYTVTVTDGGNGALNAKAIVTSASGSDTFTNTYQPAATGLALGAQKSYVKKDDNTPIVPKCGEFTFDVYEGNLTAEQLAGAKPVRTATNGADGSVNFDAFSYAKPGTHEYTIVERKGDLAYVTYDAAVHHAVVTVADNAGTLQASVAYDGTNVTKPSFTNTYEAQATDSGAIALTKSVDVHDGSYQLKAGDFAFELVGSDGSVIQTQKNDAHGKVAFDKLTFDHAGTFTYTVREVQPTGDAPGVPGVTYTGKTYTLTYVVKDNNDGKLVVESSTVKPSEGTENGVTPNTMTFANSYQPGQTSYQISGTKVLENADPATTRTPADGEFTFALIDVATGQEIDRTTNVGKAFTFKAISYTATGSHAYQVKEVAGQDGTITYSDAVLDVTVSATDDGSGQLTATANKTAADLTFTNTYTPTATTATITGTKALTGRDLAEGEFSFDLKDADGNVVQTVQNGADGTFGFAPLQLDKVGTYVYTVSERAGATANGVTYDTTVFTATVTVTENAETHALETQVAYSKGGKAADAVAFSNSYAPAATEVKLGASKVLSGKDLKEGQFSFQLKDADGKVLQTAKNAADGTVGFEAISYDKPGTYAYSISEVDDGQKNVTYDAAEHRVTVTVTDDGAGHLVATVTYDGDVAPVFKNTYTPPTTPPVNPPTNPPSKPPVPKEEKPGLPNMGDTSLSPMALGGIAGGAVVLIAAGVILRRRNR
ncbi:MAG: Spy0128 family protein [Collinsella sp.]